MNRKQKTIARHWSLFRGLYTKGYKKLPQGLIHGHGSPVIGDIVFGFTTEADRLSKQVAIAKSFLKRPFYLVVFNEEEEKALRSHLPGLSQSTTTSIWMKVLKSSFNDNAAKHPDLKIIKARKSRQKKDYLAVYKKSYIGHRDNGCGIPTLKEQEFEIISESFNHSAFTHFVAYKGKKPVAIASIGAKKTTCCLYNVGILPEERLQGYGAAISAHATQYVFNGQRSPAINKIFLQTETPVVYEKIGYEVAFVPRFIAFT